MPGWSNQPSQSGSGGANLVTGGASGAPQGSGQTYSSGMFGTAANELGIDNPFVAQGPAKGSFNWTGPSQQSLGQGITDAQGRAGPQMNAGYYGGQYANDAQNANSSRMDQNSYVEMMRERAMGQGGPSAAEAQMRAGTDQSIAAQMAMAHAAPANQAGLGAYNAAQQAGALQQHNVQNTGILRAQEQQQATQAYGQAIADRRAQDYMAQGLDAEQARAQAQMDLGRMGQNDQMSLGYLGAQMQGAAAQQGGQISYEGMNQGTQAVNAGIAQQNANTNAAIFNGVVNGASKAMTAGMG